MTQSVVESFKWEYVSITKSPENPKISAIARETKKIKIFLQGTYMSQNFIPKTPTIFYPMTKGISKIYQLARE